MDKIKQIVDNHFHVYGDYEVDPATGKVSSSSSVRMRVQHVMVTMPVTWHHVGGSFDCGHSGLHSLVGSPLTVGGNFSCNNNNLESLAGAPTQVGGYFDCSTNELTTLVHAPKQIMDLFTCIENPLLDLKGMPELMGSVEVTWDPGLPLLRCLNAQLDIDIYDAPSQLREIIQRYAGQGKSGAIACAVELGRAGYKENARW